MNTLVLASNEDTVIPVVAIAGGLLVAAIGIIAGTIRKVYQTNEREESRREIAAYVAEGSMTAEEGERLLKAGKTTSDKSCD